jgi:hypothetical protein
MLAVVVSRFPESLAFWSVRLRKFLHYFLVSTFGNDGDILLTSEDGFVGALPLLPAFPFLFPFCCI